MSNKALWLIHEFSVHDHDTDWNEVAGVYIFAGVNSEGKWSPLYIGQAESLAARLPTHERWLEAVRLGATHVHAMTVTNAALRVEIESNLIQSYQPRLNVQLK